jgi:hypothetical protein
MLVNALLLGSNLQDGIAMKFVRENFEDKLDPLGSSTHLTPEICCTEKLDKSLSGPVPLYRV